MPCHFFGRRDGTPRATWKELVLPRRVIERLLEFILWVTQRHQFEQWSERIAVGPVALFTGPPGTGKSLAAEVIAKTLDRPLLRVYLGRLVSKYIAETEKNLGTLFLVTINKVADCPRWTWDAGPPS